MFKYLLDEVDFYEQMKDPKIKLELASSFYKESFPDIWDYFRFFYDLFGIEPMILTFNGDTLDRINDYNNKKYVIIAVMLESDINMVLDYALNDEAFCNIIRKNADNYKELFVNIDQTVIDRYIKKISIFCSKVFSLN